MHKQEVLALEREVVVAVRRRSELPQQLAAQETAAMVLLL
jgi:hypothetical protein